MFGISKDRLIEGLKEIAGSLCVYHPLNFREREWWKCDCKYGAKEKNLGRSEDGSGCPEVYMAKEIIKAMTPFEFKRIAKRAKITLPL